MNERADAHGQMSWGWFWACAVILYLMWVL
jgi:hypothetical protein